MPFAPTEEDWMRANYVKMEQFIPMRDGVKLYTSIFVPRNKKSKHPILLTRTPYSCRPYGPGKFSRAQWPSYWTAYTRENYIIVLQDVRGRWMSEGEFVDVRPYIRDKKSINDIDEASDAYDTIDWLIKNLPFNNGNVGVIGSSYPGLYAAMAAVDMHPAVKAVNPQAPVVDFFMGDDFHHNGAFFLLDAFNFYSSFGEPRQGPTTHGTTGFAYPDKSLYEFFLETGTLKKTRQVLGDSIPFWKDMFEHPDYDDWWKARDARRAMHNIKVPILVVGGLYDAEDCFGAWNLYKAIEKQNPDADNKIVMGPWSHDQWSTSDGSSLGDISFAGKTAIWYQENIEIPFFNYHLKDSTAKPRIAEATIFFTGRNKWETFEKWPPANMSPTPIYLHSGDTLSWNKPGPGQNFSEYTSDPYNPVPWMAGEQKTRSADYMIADQRFAARRDDVLSFETGVLEQDLVLAGPLIADLKVSINASDADFVVKLIDVFPRSGSKDGKN
ncbi:MAG TPA: CocE/NonD family hydrolase, partial [Chitinophagaceae bacterium]|nr:CocE/NonD family hydrolase [Chitinophagaceae bacterium]